MSLAFYKNVCRRFNESKEKRVLRALWSKWRMRKRDLNDRNENLTKQFPCFERYFFDFSVFLLFHAFAFQGIVERDQLLQTEGKQRRVNTVAQCAVVRRYLALIEQDLALLREIHEKNCKKNGKPDEIEKEQVDLISENVKECAVMEKRAVYGEDAIDDEEVDNVELGKPHSLLECLLSTIVFLRRW